MDKEIKKKSLGLGGFFNHINLKLRPKLILIFLVSKVIPIIMLTILAWHQHSKFGELLQNIAVTDSTNSLNDGARENIERMTTDIARAVADFLRQRDQDILLLASLALSDTALKAFSENRNSEIVKPGEWVIAEDGMSWVEKQPRAEGQPGVSRNIENDDIHFKSGFRSRPPEFFDQYLENAPLYDEITYIDLNGNEIFKYVNPNSPKKNYPLNPNKVNVSIKANTYIKAEDYFQELKKLNPGEIYVSDIIGAYVGTNYIGMYAPAVLKNVPATHPNHEKLRATGNLPMEEFIEAAKKQAFAGMENPVGQRFEGIVRWGAPVTGRDGEISGFVTLALNHDHIMEFVDYVTPMLNRYVKLPSPQDGNYAFIWDYNCRSVAHPRHHSIVGYNPLTGEPQVPWLEGTQAYERDYKNGGFLKDKNNLKIPIVSDEGTEPANDTPYYYWFVSGGEQWLAANPSWDNLSVVAAGTSWGEFYSKNKDDRNILPRFGERILRDDDGNAARQENGRYILDYQSRDKTPAPALTKAGFVGLDGRYLNNAPQCTGWMNLTENGGSGSFYILWSGIYKPTTAGAIPYYTGKYAPEKQKGSKRGFAFVTIGAGIEDFTAPARVMEEKLKTEISDYLLRDMSQLAAMSLCLFALVFMIAVLLSSYLTNNIKLLLDGISRFRSGERQFRLRSNIKDEFGALADSFDEMADSIVNSVNGALSIVNMEDKVIYMNDLALKLIGKTINDIKEVSYSEISMYPHNSKYDPIAALREGKEADALYMESQERYYKGAANYLMDQNGKKTGYIITTNDVTEIEEARKKAEHANQAKSSFLANMSHEIRTPMNAILGMSSIGAASPDIEKKNYAIQKIQDASKHLLGIINDVLDMSKIEANKYSLSVTEFFVEKMFQKVIDVINFRVDEKRHKLSVYIDPAIPSTLIGDDQRLAQVITNLLTNANKFTPEGGSIHLEALLLSEKDNKCELGVSVSDTGIGISDEQRRRLFSAFEQAETSITRKYGGTGLGLVISKNIVEMMEGKFAVKSEPGKGSVFSFTVKMARGKDVQRRFFDSEINIENIRVLAVDDDPAVLEFFIETAKRIGIACDTAGSGKEALSLIAKNGSYNFYFIDWSMPEMSGIDLTSAINAKGGKNKVIVLISAFDWDVIQNKANEAGITKFISKPLFASSIVDCINECLGPRDRNIPEEQEMSGINFKGHYILLAEDVEINREIVLALLEPTNLVIDCAENGAVAVEMFLSSPSKYEMIFMDIQMPEMDGYTATKKIREADIKWAKEVPIVAMTANVFREDIDSCAAAGMNDHIGKPLNFDDVISVLKKYIRKRN